MQQYGYCRVSAKDQNPERQIAAMVAEGIPRKNIYIDKFSGKDFSRPGYIQMLKKLNQGDVLIVKSIDRLGRNYAEILEEWRKITKDMGVDIIVLDMPLLNTCKDQEDLTGVFISDLVLQILAYVAETERAFIKQRQAEGIAVAMAKGVHFGNRRKETPECFEVFYEMWKAGKMSLRKASELAGMSVSTFYRRCKEKDANTFD